MVLPKSLQQRLEFSEIDSHHDAWIDKTTVDYTEIRLWYMIKIVFVGIFIFVDVTFNSSVDHDEADDGDRRTTVTMILFGAQVVGQILMFVVFFLLLCATYLFRVGLISLLSRHFKEVLAVSFIYIIWTAILGLERLSLVNRDGSYLALWTSSYFYFTVAHKILACAYYVINLRTILRLGDPKFYTKEPWVQLYQRG
jgi:hypothetical protein